MLMGLGWGLVSEGFLWKRISTPDRTENPKKYRSGRRFIVRVVLKPGVSHAIQQEWRHLPDNRGDCAIGVASYVDRLLALACASRSQEGGA